MTDYRERIYRHYVTARGSELAPQDVAGLAARAPYLRRLIRRHFPGDRGAVRRREHVRVAKRLASEPGSVARLSGEWNKNECLQNRIQIPSQGP